MNIGDYVRTDTGVIEKLEGIHEQNKTNDTIIKLNKMGGGRYAHILDINSEFAEEFDKNFSRGNIIKSSPNIIDLLEKSDLVEDYTGDIYKVDYIYDGYVFTTFIGEDGITKTLTNYQIKSIVTHEQFESMKYKVGE